MSDCISCSRSVVWVDRLLGGGRGAVVTQRQRWRLDRIADVIATSAGISANDLDNALFAERGAAQLSARCVMMVG